MVPLSSPLVVLGTTEWLERVVVPPHVRDLLPANPAPLALALARHVVATRRLLRQDPASWTLLSVEFGQRRPLLLQYLALVCLTSLWPNRMSVAVVVAERTTASTALQLWHDRGVCIPRVAQRGTAELVALGAGPDLGVILHPDEAPVLLQQAGRRPCLNLVFGHLGIAAIRAGARTPELCNASLLNAVLHVHRHAVRAGTVRLPAAGPRHHAASGRHALEADVAPLRGHNRHGGHVDAMPVQCARNGAAHLHGPAHAGGVRTLQERAAPRDVCDLRRCCCRLAADAPAAIEGRSPRGRGDATPLGDRLGQLWGQLRDDCVKANVVLLVDARLQCDDGEKGWGWLLRAARLRLARVRACGPSAVAAAAERRQVGARVTPHTPAPLAPAAAWLHTGSSRGRWRRWRRRGGRRTSLLRILEGCGACNDLRQPSV
mmetsp:Transcript_60528/g.167728  ORF Transcript_60528/g.167728 Transcript_60528/m.167728 type:complete len:432 (-) Transcript_60528:34-1329(-)